MQIQARINRRSTRSTDDERKPPETGIKERDLKRVKNGRRYLIPASEQTIGHSTIRLARFWKQPFSDWLQDLPRKGK